MPSTTQNRPLTFSESIKAAFSQYMREQPSQRRVSDNEKDAMIEWLTDSNKRPASQEEFSRRNYIRKTFSWDVETSLLLAAAKKDGDRPRVVVTTNMVADIIEGVHENNGHAGWDATWRDISNSYYGIMRSDVIFLLRRCQVCSKNPSKRPKSAAATIEQSQQVSPTFSDSLHMGEEQGDQFTYFDMNLSQNSMQEGGDSVEQSDK